VSIGKRLVNLVRSNLNSLFERDSDSSSRAPIEELTDEDLERELIRRRQRREAADRGAQEGADASVDQSAWEEAERAVHEGSGRFRTTGGARRPHRASSQTTGSRRPTPPTGRDQRIAQLYAQLECPYGSDLTTVRKHYRALMLKYHPDMHSGSPEKQRLATDLSQRLTTAYNELRRHLSGG